MPGWIAWTIMAGAGWCVLSVLAAFAIANIMGRLDESQGFDENDAVLPLTRALALSDRLERERERLARV
jgi:hypothetical protein